MCFIVYNDPQLKNVFDNKKKTFLNSERRYTKRIINEIIKNSN